MKIIFSSWDFLFLSGGFIYHLSWFWEPFNHCKYYTWTLGGNQGHKFTFWKHCVGIWTLPNCPDLQVFLNTAGGKMATFSPQSLATGTKVTAHWPAEFILHSILVSEITSLLMRSAEANHGSSTIWPFLPYMSNNSFHKTQREKYCSPFKMCFRNHFIPVFPFAEFKSQVWTQQKKIICCYQFLCW